MIYLDYNATTPVLPEVRDAMLPYFCDAFGNASSAHALGRKSRDAIEEARSHIADLIGAVPEEIIFTSGATESNQTVLRTFLEADFPVAASQVEHQSVLSALEGYANHKTWRLIPVDVYGQLDCTQLCDEMNKWDKPGLLSLIWANNETGILSPVEKVGTLIRAKCWRLHLDAAQVLGKLPIDISSMDVDYMSLSAHKIYGPQGIGATYVRNGVPFTAMIKGTQESGRRGGTEAVALIVGFGEAARLARLQLDNRRTSVKKLRDQLEADLSDLIASSIINGATVERLPNTTSVTFPGVDAEVLASLLSEQDIYVSTGSACKSSAPTPSHVLLAMGRQYKDAAATLRISLSHSNTQADVTTLLCTLQQLVPALK